MDLGQALRFSINQSKLQDQNHQTWLNILFQESTKAAQKHTCLCSKILDQKIQSYIPSQKQHSLNNQRLTYRFLQQVPLIFYPHLYSFHSEPQDVIKYVITTLPSLDCCFTFENSSSQLYPSCMEIMMPATYFGSSLMILSIFGGGGGGQGGILVGGNLGGGIQLLRQDFEDKPLVSVGGEGAGSLDLSSLTCTRRDTPIISEVVKTKTKQTSNTRLFTLIAEFQYLQLIYEQLLDTNQNKHYTIYQPKLYIFCVDARPRRLLLASFFDWMIILYLFFIFFLSFDYNCFIAGEKTFHGYIFCF